MKLIGQLFAFLMGIAIIIVVYNQAPKIFVIIACLALFLYLTGSGPDYGSGYPAVG